MKTITEKLPTTIRSGCATGVGYGTHMKHKEIPCDKCRKFEVIRHAAWAAKNREKINATSSRYYYNNLEKAREATAKWTRENPETVNRKSKAWRERNPQHMAMLRRRRRAREVFAESEPYTVDLILELFGTDCHICKTPIDLNAPRLVGRDGWQMSLHLDHVIALSNGGSDLIENIRPSHALCNVKKRAA